MKNDQRFVFAVPTCSEFLMKRVTCQACNWLMVGRSISTVVNHSRHNKEATKSQAQGSQFNSQAA